MNIKIRFKRVKGPKFSTFMRNFDGICKVRSGAVQHPRRTHQEVRRQGQSKGLIQALILDKFKKLKVPHSDAVFSKESELKTISHSKCRRLRKKGWNKYEANPLDNERRSRSSYYRRSPGRHPRSRSPNPCCRRSSDRPR